MLLKAFRLFVSSTFSDFAQEREVLQSKVFPALEAEPEVVAKLVAQLVAPIASSPEAFRAVLKEEHDRWARIIAAGGIKAE